MGEVGNRVGTIRAVRRPRRRTTTATVRPRPPRGRCRLTFLTDGEERRTDGTHRGFTRHLEGAVRT